MKSGDIACTKEKRIITTNAELLNNLFNCNLISYQRTWYPLDDKTMVWMVALDNKINAGFRNKCLGDTIIEEYAGNKAKLPTNIEVGLKYTRRIVFEKIPRGNTHIYVFKGIYELDTLEGSYYYRVLKKISDEL